VHGSAGAGGAGAVGGVWVYRWDAMVTGTATILTDVRCAFFG
jgi:hypothetical protein